MIVDLLGAWPIGAVFAATALRLVEHTILHDPRPIISARDRWLVELLSVASQVLIVAGGVGFALLFGRRLGL